MIERPYIVGFSNQTDVHNFDVTIAHPDLKTATDWANGYFGSVQYLESNQDGNHTFRRIREVSK